MLERLFVEIDGIRISILKGKERDVFYVHSSGSDALQWEKQLEEIGGYAIDLPNHGKSEKVEVKSVDDYAYYVGEAVKKTMKKAVLVGHSLGGAVVQKVYLNNPEVCKGLVLVGTGARLRVLPDILEGLKKNPEKAVELILEMGFAEKGEEYEKKKREFLERTEVLHLDLSLCDKFDLLEDYKSGKIKINVPTLIVVGEKDRLTPVKYAEFFHKHIPNSKLVVIKGASHMVMIEKPEEFNKALEEFLKEVSREKRR